MLHAADKAVLGLAEVPSRHVEPHVACLSIVHSISVCSRGASGPASAEVLLAMFMFFMDAVIASENTTTETTTTTELDGNTTQESW